MEIGGTPENRQEKVLQKETLQERVSTTTLLENVSLLNNVINTPANFQGEK